jgi:hypothetical protein
MTVLHVDTGLTMRGGQWQVLALVQGLRERGIDQRVLARGELLERLRAEGFAAEQASPWRVWRSPATLVHAHDARAHTWAAGAMRTPLVVSRRVAFPVRSGLLSRWKYSRAAMFLAVSKFVAGRLAEAGVNASRIRVVYDGVASGPVRPMSTGTLILAPAFDDPMKGNVILRETGLTIKYSFNLSTDLQDAKVFVYLTHEEGLGSAVLLAQAAGVPVVASRVGGLPEIVVHEETGLLTANDPVAVRAAVERLLNDDRLRERLSSNARRRYEERFTADRMVEATLAAYRELTAAVQ